MIAFPSMLIPAAREAKMPCPDDVEDIADFDKNQYPHFFVYCMLQLCRPIGWGNHWNNAKIIARVPEENLKTMSEEDFIKLGFNLMTKPTELVPTSTKGNITMKFLHNFTVGIEGEGVALRLFIAIRDGTTVMYSGSIYAADGSVTARQSQGAIDRSVNTLTKFFRKLKKFAK